VEPASRKQQDDNEQICDFHTVGRNGSGPVSITGEN
jgi:hypothetical protein